MSTMFAKLVIYQTNPANANAFTANTKPIMFSNQPAQSILSERAIEWQLVADNLSAGKLTELLVCLDELGFDEPDAPFAL